MIYKFNDEEAQSILEFEQINEDLIQIRIQEYGDDLPAMFCLNKHSVYKLIGALHLLHKEMK
jgi:hypothetical protein